MLRLARPSDVEPMREVEGEADGLFATIDVEVSGGTMPADEVLAYVEAGRAWVVEVDGVVVGGGVVGFVDGEPHVHQLSVRPSHGRQGHGSALVACMAEWARAEGHERLTLTTFRDVPFNAPFYERHGFQVVEPGGPELRAIAVEEAERFPDPRVCMARVL